MSRSFDYFHYIHRPDAVLFLGDLMDGGRETIDQEVFNKNLRRFHRIFQTQRTAYNTRPVFEYITKSQLPVPDTDSLHASNESTIGAGKVDIESPEGTGHNDPVKTPVQDNQSELYRLVKPLPTSPEAREQLRKDGKSLRLYMAGNHDVGFGDTTISTALHTYRGEFGPLNYELDVGNHRLVVLDTLALSAKTKNSPAKVEAQHLLDQIEERDPRKSPPRILFTHVPLYRPPHTFCGDERETKPSIEQGRGSQYQNLVELDLSQEILQKGVLQPGLVMLNLYNPSSLQGITGDASNSTADATTARATEATIALRSCMLPTQLHIYFSYAAFLALTLAWTLIQRYWWLRRHSLFRTGTVTSKAGSPQSFSDEDDIPDSFDAKAIHLPLLPIASDTSARSFTLPSSSFCLLSRLYWQCVWNDIWYIAALPVILYVLLLVL
ncbi:hypothetical protein BGW42_005698 [Actinomortierella wolfii]|nr:hypothetical protein BGW42_005698 [Actinomortierella wolfii]